MKKNLQVLAIAILALAGATQVNANWFSKKAPYERVKTTLCIALPAVLGVMNGGSHDCALGALGVGFIGGMARAFTIKKLDTDAQNDTSDHYNCLCQFATLGAIGALGTLATKEPSYALWGVILGSIATLTQYWRQNQPCESHQAVTTPPIL